MATVETYPITYADGFTPTGGRGVSIILPSGYTEGEALPWVVWLHEYTGDGILETNVTHYKDLVDTYRFILVTVNSDPDNMWFDTDLHVAHHLEEGIALAKTKHNLTAYLPALYGWSGGSTKVLIELRDHSQLYSCFAVTSAVSNMLLLAVDQEVVDIDTLWGTSIFGGNHDNADPTIHARWVRYSPALALSAISTPRQVYVINGTVDDVAIYADQYTPLLAALPAHNLHKAITVTGGAHADYLANDTYAPDLCQFFLDHKVAATVTFPQSPTIDDFNRASLGTTNWNSPYSTGDSALRIVSSTLLAPDASGPYSDGNWKTVKGPNCEVRATLTTVPGTNDFVLIFSLMHSPGDSENSYWLAPQKLAGTDVIAIGVDPGGTPLLSFAVEFANGDEFGLRVTSTIGVVLLEAFRKPSGGSWAPLGYIVDTRAERIDTAGYPAIGIMGNTARMDNLGAGTLHFVSIVELASATDTPSATTGTAVSASETETASATDTPSAVMSAVASTTETASAAATSSAVTTVVASETETASATDTPSAVVVTAAACTEAASATETPSALLNAVAAIAEPAGATDTPTAIVQAVASLAEIASASDTPDAGVLRPADLTETAGASDMPAATLTQPAAITELASATDTPSAIAQQVAAIVETASASESSDGVIGVFVNAAQVELASASDMTDAVIEHAAAALETASATDTPSAILDMLAAIVDNASASDTPDAVNILFGDLLETAVATEASDAFVTTTWSVASLELAAATDTITAQVDEWAAHLELAAAFDLADAWVAPAGPGGTDIYQATPRDDLRSTARRIYQAQERDA